MSSQILLPETTDMGGLFSITDENPQYPRGFKFQKVGDGGDVCTLEYLNNGVGADVAAGVFYLKFLGATAASPGVDGFTVSDAQAAEICIAQAAIPSTYWGWYLTKGKTSVTGQKMFWDGVDYNATDDCTDGEAFTIANGIATCGDAAYTYMDGTTYQTIAGTVSETITAAATSVHVDLIGGVILCAT